ncbi:MAG: hypothetical protein WCK83_15725 [Burkholderiales bacterium]
MGMRIGSAGTDWARESSSVGNWQQRQQNFKSLNTALQAGDLTAAQQAFAAMTANNPNATNGTGPLAQIGQALQAGDLATAQQAAQAWRGHRHAGAAPSANAAADPAVQTFLSTLTPNAAASTSTDSTSANGSAAPSQTDLIAQALVAFEKNLFDSLQAQDAATTSASTSAASATTPATDAAAATAPATPSVTGHHHHGSGTKLMAELKSLIAQTAPTATTASTTAATSATTTASSSGLDQSFNNLLQALGVSGNNASLNDFLQALASKMQGPGAAPVKPVTAA